ncbi:MAG: ATP-dependent DNA helicase [Clostridia bacterium]|nr:ATP-dependent DNA helicase [Clostridia bacterium]
MTKKEVKISIRNLVELILRSGNLDSRFSGSSRAQEGIKLHQKIQKAGGETYNPEVSLSFSVEYPELTITVEGRADGIITEDKGFVVDEIKTTVRPLELIDEEFSLLHWAQAMCYAYIYTEQNTLPGMGVQLTYYQLDTEEMKQLRKDFTREELKHFFHDLVEKYFVWAKLTLDWSLKRDLSVKDLEFPFASYRRGQRELAVAAYRTITKGKKLFVQAPTGIGKTISTLFPAVKAVGEGVVSKIFYLTAKTVTRQVAEDAFLHMRKQGLKLKTITLTAKEKVCFQKEVTCNPEQCEYAKGHFDRINEAIMDIIQLEDHLTREKMELCAKKHCVCPFELALDLSLWADLIICDYNYVFDPSVYLKRFFLNSKENYAFLIDEAHNLVDRARDMFSASLDKTKILELKKAMKTRNPQIAKALNKVNSYFVDQRKQCGAFSVKKEPPKELILLLRGFIRVSEEWLAKNQDTGGLDELLDLYFSALNFIKIFEFYDERYVITIEAFKNEVRIKLFCLDPSHLLGEAVKRGKSAVFFSATLTPLNFFRDILGGNEEDYTMKLPSPFDRNQLCVMAAGNISTKYKNREGSYEKIAEYIKAFVTQRQGNYMVYFPSYKYLNEVVGLFHERFPEVPTAIQAGNMSEEERQAFLEKFQPDTKELFVGFGVLGGIFSEGIDLKGDRLIGVAVIGVGLPQVNREQDVIMRYYEEKNGLGFEYAYMYPGMNKVLQAVGRVIRSERDRGAVLLIDERFLESSYRALIPEHWRGYQNIKSPADLTAWLDKFW